jgi:hypothetical protein
MKITARFAKKIQCHEADIVSGFGVGFSWVAKTND